MTIPNIDDIAEYKNMRNGLMALRLAVTPSVSDDLLLLCERAVFAIRDLAYKHGRDDGYADGYTNGYSEAVTIESQTTPRVK